MADETTESNAALSETAGSNAALSETAGSNAALSETAESNAAAGSDAAAVAAVSHDPSGDGSGVITGTAHNNRRKTREGLVVSNTMDKTAVVITRDRVRHRRYNKTVQRDKRLYVHDEDNDLNVGDRVRVIETRPLSKSKRWRLLEVLERAR